MPTKHEKKESTEFTFTNSSNQSHCRDTNIITSVLFKASVFASLSTSHIIPFINLLPKIPHASHNFTLPVWPHSFIAINHIDEEFNQIRFEVVRFFITTIFGAGY